MSRGQQARTKGNFPQMRFRSYGRLMRRLRKNLVANGGRLVIEHNGKRWTLGPVTMRSIPMKSEFHTSIMNQVRS